MIILLLVNQKKNEDLVLINKNVLEMVNPKYMFFIDESTLIIQKMPIELWDEFLKNCKKNNCYDEFNKRTKNLFCKGLSNTNFATL